MRSIGTQLSVSVQCLTSVMLLCKNYLQVLDNTYIQMSLINQQLALFVLIHENKTFYTHLCLCAGAWKNRLCRVLLHNTFSNEFIPAQRSRAIIGYLFLCSIKLMHYLWGKLPPPSLPPSHRHTHTQINETLWNNFFYYIRVYGTVTFKICQFKI